MVEFKNVSFSYGDKEILNSFSAVFPEGITCLKAPSGRGKTTIMRLIVGLEKPSGGAITGLPNKCAYMFQGNRLLPWLTARENVALVLPKGKKDEADMWLDRVGMLPYAGQKSLSGGQMRRVALARALAFDGEILLLDEPFTGLDDENIKRCAGLIREVKTSVIAAIHSDEEIALLGNNVNMMYL